MLTLGTAASISGGTITQSLLYPRLDVQSSKRFLYQTRIDFTQKIASRAHLNLDAGFTPAIVSSQNKLRLYALNFKLYPFPKLQLEIGRTVYWNSLFLSRVDGARISLQRGNNKIIYAGGIIAPDYFESRSYSTDYSSHYLEWRLDLNHNRYHFSSWVVKQPQSQDQYAGFLFRQQLFLKIQSTGYGAWDVKHSRFEKYRLRFARSVGSKATVFVTYRYHSYSRSNPFPWTKTALKTQPMLSTGIRVRWNNTLFWTNSIVTRTQTTNRNFRFNSSLQGRNFQVVFISETHHLARSAGGSLTARHRLSRLLSIGSNLFYRNYTFNSAEADFKTTGISGWLSFTPNTTWSLKITGQFFQNRYFNLDTRIGLIINYAF